MPRFYKSGRTRTIRQRVTVSINGTFRGLGSDSGTSTSLLPGTSYSVTPASGNSPWIAYSQGFGVRPAFGLAGTFGSFQRVIGVQVRSKTNNGFVPLLVLPQSAFAVTASISADVVINRVMNLIEVFDHDNNGRRRDRYGPSGTCYETYTVNDSVTFTSRDGTDMVEGQAPPALGLPGSIFPVGFGIVEGVSATACALASFSGSPNISAGSAISWQVEYLGATGDALSIEPPDAPSHSTAMGSSSWGSVVANAPAIVPLSTVRRSVGASFEWMPRHTFDVTMRPLDIGTNASIVAQHRLEIDYFNGPATGVTYNTNGETVHIAAGGTKWNVTHSGTVASAAGTTGEPGGFSRNYNSMLPIPSRLRCTTSPLGHFSCRVGAPYSAISLTQAEAVTIPGGAGTSVSTSGTTTLSVGSRIGYRYVRVRAKTPTGTGTLTVSSYLNDNVTTPTATKTLTTTAANTTEVLEFDLLNVPGCTPDSQLTLEQLVFSATGNAFTIETLELFRKDESLLQSLSCLRALPPAETSADVSWINGYTGGVESLRMRAAGGSLPTVNSLNFRQLVAEINGTTRHSYPGTWSPPNPFTLIDSGGGGSVSPLLGWTAADLAPPRVGKDYGLDAIGEPGDFRDSDIYVAGLWGDGVIGTTLCLRHPEGALLAQRFSFFVEPGVLPGDCGYTGTSGGDAAEGGMSMRCPIDFTALFQGLPIGMIIPGGSLPVAEISFTNTSGTDTYADPIPRGHLVARASGFAIGNTGLRGTIFPGNFFTNEIDNAGGTPSAMTLAPYHRQLIYDRWWPDQPTEMTALEHDPPRGWIHVARGLAIYTYARESGTGAGLAGFEEIFKGEELTVDTIHRLERITGGRLLVLAQVESAYKLYQSGDGGQTIEELLTMTNAASSLVGYDGVRNWLVVWWEDATTHQVKRRVSRDGGSSWESAQSCTWTPAGGSSENLLAAIKDVKFVRELAGRFVMVIKKEGASSGATIMSGDGGLTWSQVL